MEDNTLPVIRLDDPFKDVHMRIKNIIENSVQNLKDAQQNMGLSAHDLQIPTAIVHILKRLYQDAQNEGMARFAELGIPAYWAECIEYIYNQGEMVE